MHRVVLNGIEYAQVYQGPGMIPTEIIDELNLPIAYRPHTIYAPIGEDLTIDLLWSAELPAKSMGESVNLSLQSADDSGFFTSQAVITEMDPAVKISTHSFELPPDMARDTYTLFVNEKPLGEIKARLLTLPSDFEPLSAVMAGQLKLVGFRQEQMDNQLVLDLAWQAWPKATNDYTVFIQLLDVNNQRVTGVDVLPERGFTELDRKEVMITQYVIPLTDDVQPDAYKLLVGLYYFAGNDLINVGAVTLEDPVVLE